MQAKSIKLPLLVCILCLLASVILLRSAGRLWWCACGEWFLWAGDIWTRHNSQHLIDPYIFTHVLHGMAFYGLLSLVFSRWPVAWRFVAAIAIEAAWEVLENSEYVIRRYREATVSLGYEGDTIANSLGDIAACGLGAVIARQLGWRRSAILFVAVEIILLFWIRDSLLLNILMLIYPLESVKTWQMNH